MQQIEKNKTLRWIIQNDTTRYVIIDALALIMIDRKTTNKHRQYAKAASVLKTSFELG